MEPYVRPGIDDRPDYDKALSDEDKASVSRLAREDRRLPPEASAKQPEAQAARLTAAGGASVAAAGVDTAVPDYASSFLDMRDPMTSADGVKPSRTDVLRLKWAFALAAVLITAPWVMLNLIAIPNHIALLYGLNTENLLLDVTSQSALATPLAVVIALGAVLSIVVTPLISTFSDHTRVIIGRRTPWLVSGGVLAALATLILSATDAVVGLVAGWLLMQPAYVMLTAPLVAAIAERVPDKYRVGVDRWHAVGVLVGEAAGGVIGGMSVAFGATDVFLCAAVLFAVSGVIPVLVWPHERSSVDQKWARTDWRDVFSMLRGPRGDNAHEFRRLFLSRVFMMAAMASTSVFLWYIVRFALYGNRALPADPTPLTLPAGTLIMMFSIVMFGGALLATGMAGIITDRIELMRGSRNRNFRIAVVIAGGLYVIGLLAGMLTVLMGGEKAILLLAFLAGFSLSIYDVLMHSLVVESLPDPRNAGRDLGFYALSKPLGLILGVVVGAAAVNLFSPSLGYVALFPTAIVCVCVAVLLPLFAGKARNS
nr:MFS transporter [Bifidobacterium pongonis]